MNTAETAADNSTEAIAADCATEAIAADNADVTAPAHRPFLSVIVPVYKVERWLEECVDSVLRQSFSDLEVILVDDGSPDGCPALCDALAARHERVRAVHKANGGLGSARNCGMSRARGRYVTFLDGDDSWEGDSLGEICGTARDEDADMVCFGVRQEMHDGTTRLSVPFTERRVFTDAAEIMTLAASVVSPQPSLGPSTLSMSVCFAIFRREILPEAFLSERDVASEDMPFKIKAILNSRRIVCLPAAPYRYRWTPGSLSRTFSFRKFEAFKVLSGVIAEIFKGTPYSDAGDLLTVGTTGSLLHSMYLTGTPVAERRRCLRTLAADTVWDTLRVRPEALSRKEKPLLQILRRHSFTALFILNETFYGLRRLRGFRSR